jgi:phosphoglycerol transferase
MQALQTDLSSGPLKAAASNRFWKISRTALPYIFVVLATLLALNKTYAVRRANLSYPLQLLYGDGNLSAYTAKALGEGSLFHNSRVGAPFGFDTYDFYEPDFVHFGALKLFMALTGNAVLTVNLYYLLGFVLIALSAFYVLRSLRISAGIAIPCALLYAFTPSHLSRSYYHLFLSEYYLLPLVVLLALRIMSDSVPDGRCQRLSPLPELEDTPRKGELKRFGGLLLFAVILSILIGLSGVYYSAYSMLFLAAAACYGVFACGRKIHAAIGLACVATIALTVIAGLWPVLHYRDQHGPNTAVIQRTIADTEIYSLQIAELYLPSPHSPIRKLRELNSKYADQFPVVNANESISSSLGSVGAIGFTILVLWAFLRHSNTASNGVMKSLVLLTLVGVLYATIGGFGTLTSFLVAPEIRANTRIVFFIAFFALAAVAIVLQKAIGALPSRFAQQAAAASIMVVLLVFGLYDEGITQMRAEVLATRPGETTAFAGEAHFVHRLESQLPFDAAILELPYQPFPETPPLFEMQPYDQLQPYVVSHNLRWSYPTMRGRPADEWIRDLSSQQPPELVTRAVLAGFCGIYINRAGYADRAVALESRLRAITGAEPLVSEGGNLSFFSLAPYCSAVKGQAATERWSKLIAKAGPQFEPLFLSGIYDSEAQGKEEWRWCNRQGSLEIYNGTGRDQNAELKGEVATAFSQKSYVSFRLSNTVERVAATSAGNEFAWRVVLRPGPNLIEFSTNAARVPAPTDPRNLYFRLERLSITAE